MLERCAKNRKQKISFPGQVVTTSVRHTLPHSEQLSTRYQLQR